MTATKTELVKTELGENVVYAVDGDTLTITVDLAHRGELSSTGKTIRVGSTKGNHPVTGTDVVLSVNAYVYAVKK
jgi:hypothetical protein